MIEHAGDGRILPEEAAHRLLARAVELDATHGAGLTIDQLRRAASDAGISEKAFQAALAEWTQSGDVPNLQLTSLPTASTTGRQWLRQQWREVRRAVVGQPVRNVVALAAFWGVLTALVALDRANAVPWLIRKATDPLALSIGALVASRLRARPVAMVLAGLAVSQGAEFIMDAAMGRPAVIGFGSHVALMIAGVAGVALGFRGMRPGAPRAAHLDGDPKHESKGDRAERGSARSDESQLRLHTA